MADEARLAAVRDETRFELGLLHERVNALLAAEAFLTIAYTAAMSNGAAWGRQFAASAAPALAVLGLLLALLALPGVAATSRIVLTQTALQENSLNDCRGLLSAVITVSPAGVLPSKTKRGSLLFFRTVPLLFALAWIVLLVVTSVLLS